MKTTTNKPTNKNKLVDSKPTDRGLNLCKPTDKSNGWVEELRRNSIYIQDVGGGSGDMIPSGTAHKIINKTVKEERMRFVEMLEAHRIPGHSVANGGIDAIITKLTKENDVKKTIR